MEGLNIMNKEHCDFNHYDFIPVGRRLDVNEKKTYLKYEDGRTCELKGFEYVMTRENFEDYMKRRRNEKFEVELIEVYENNGKISLTNNKIRCESSEINPMWGIQMV